jgi:hypothetical protein
MADLVGCWFGHDWNKWQVTARREVKSAAGALFGPYAPKEPDYILVGMSIQQERTCQRCGLLEARKDVVRL